MTPADLVDEIAALGDLDLEGLRRCWRDRFGTWPRLRSSDLLRLALAWRIQADVLGDLDAETRRQLRRRGPVQAEGRELGIGAKLRREWQGNIVEVIVEEDGFRCGETSYRSLSAVATAVAGTRWNGPRFFGLRQAGR